MYGAILGDIIHFRENLEKQFSNILIFLFWIL